MRVGEITGLRWCDIDFDEDVISVNHTLVFYNHGDNKGCTFSVNTPKTEAGNRTIPLIPAVKEALQMEKEKPLNVLDAENVNMNVLRILKLESILRI